MSGIDSPLITSDTYIPDFSLSAEDDEKDEARAREYCHKEEEVGDGNNEEGHHCSKKLKLEEPSEEQVLEADATNSSNRKSRMSGIDSPLITSDTYIPDFSLSHEEGAARALEYCHKTMFGPFDPEGQDPEFRRLVFSFGPSYSRRFCKPLISMSIYDFLEREKRHQQQPLYTPHPYTKLPRMEVKKLLWKQILEEYEREREEEEKQYDDDDQDEEEEVGDGNKEEGHHCSKKLELEEPSEAQQSAATEEQVLEADATTSSNPEMERILRTFVDLRK